jgi:(2Fe-2S) ferredoxin
MSAEIAAEPETLDIPQVFRHHVFMCMTERPPGHPRGSCGQQGAKPLFEHLANRVERLGRGDIGVTASGCMGFCAAGPLFVVYPQGIWYRPKTREDIDEVIDAHLVGGKPVVRLIVVPRL